MFTAETFVPLIDRTFTLNDVIESGVVELRLVDVKVRTVSSLDGRYQQIANGEMRAPFVLTFSGSPAIPLAQRMYQVTQESIGQFPVFLVPVGETESIRIYEAVFA